MPGKRKRLDHRALLEDPLIREWYDSNRLRSARTADVNLRQLGLCLHEIRLTPEGFIEEAKSHPRDLERRLVRYATDLQRRGRLGTYIAKTFTGAGSFLRKHHVEFAGFPKLKVIRGESIESERVPSQEELGRLLRVLPLRGQVSALLMAHAGLRPGAFATYQAGDTALRLRDLPELDLKAMTFTRTPFQIRVPGALSKTRRSYVTFGTPELAETITTYLRDRQARPRWSKGEATPPEVLSRDSPVVAVRDTETETGFVTVKAVTAEIHHAIVRVVPPDVRWRPYVLRAYASTQLLLAESKGLIIRDVREAILGHDLGVSGRYNLDKKLSPAMVDELRKQYARAMPLLQSTGRSEDADSAVREVMRLWMADAKGLSPEQIAEVLAGKLDAEQIRELLKSAAAPSQELVSLAELPARLASGWEFLSSVGDGQQVVVRSSPRATGPSSPPSLSPNSAEGGIG